MGGAFHRYEFGYAGFDAPTCETPYRTWGTYKADPL